MCCLVVRPSTRLGQPFLSLVLAPETQHLCRSRLRSLHTLPVLSPQRSRLRLRAVLLPSNACSASAAPLVTPPATCRETSSLSPPAPLSESRALSTDAPLVGSASRIPGLASSSLRPVAALCLHRLKHTRARDLPRAGVLLLLLLLLLLLPHEACLRVGH